MGSNPPPSTKEFGNLYHTKLPDLFQHSIRKLVTYPKVQKESWVTLDSRQYLLEFQKETILNLLILWEDFYKHSSIYFDYLFSFYTKPVLPAVPRKSPSHDDNTFDNRHLQQFY